MTKSNSRKSLNIRYNNKWLGYFNYKDITSLPPNSLTAGSKNVIVQDGAKLDSRGGSRYFGAQGTIGTNTNPSWTLSHRIHSSYDKFVNSQGTVMPFRVFYSGTSAQGDVLETWLPEFVAGVEQSTKKWYQVTATVPASPVVSSHRWYFTEWYDPLNVQNRVVFTYGKQEVGSFSGGYAPITAVTPTTIKTNGTWKSKGFIDAPEGVAGVVINGVTYNITSGDFSTDTITVASTAGVNINDVAFQSINIDAIPWGTADVCSQINNQVYYIDWKQRNVYLSWNRNRDALLGSTSYQGTSGLDDAVFSGTYTGTKTSTYNVSIDSVAQNSQTYSGAGVNDAYFITSGYTGTGNNTYKVSVVADTSFTFVGIPSIIPNAGDTLVGSVSGAIGKVTFIDAGGQDPAMILQTPNDFQVGDVITGTQGTYGTVATAGRQAYVQTFKNGVPYTPSGYTPFVAYAFLVGSQLLIDGISFNIGTTNTIDNWVTQKAGDYYELTVGNADTFTWTVDGVTGGTQIPITTTAQTLSNGVVVDFVKKTGHNLGDSWSIIAYQKVIKGWRDFTYTQIGDTTRYPGEGFRLQLSSNGWTMKPQEENMYINGQAGEYYQVIVKLSSDFLTESIYAQRLKTEPQKKALYPYLMNFNNNYMSVVSQEKTWDILGRQKFLELPQVKSISDWIKYDFYNSDWEDANIVYMQRKQFFILPSEGVIFIYDEFMKYWHTPQEFSRRISSISWIDNKIIGHSYERNESYELWTDDRNDLGTYNIKTSMVTPYYDYGKRFNLKETASIAMDGYVEGAPDIHWKMNFGVGGCMGIEQGKVDPVVCLPIDTASLGKSSLGYHGFGNSPTNVIPHFTFGKTFNNLTSYLRNIELTCDSNDQRWSILSLGNNAEYNTVVNSDIFNTEDLY